MSSFRKPFWTMARPKKAHPLYSKWGDKAKGVKIVLQFLIGRSESESGRSGSVGVVLLLPCL